MTRVRDIFSPASTSTLRHLATAYIPGRGASRLLRPALIDLIVSTIKEEELSLLQRASKRRMTSDASAQDICSGPHRALQAKYGDLFKPYLQSTARLDDPRFADYLPVAAAASTSESSGDSDSSADFDRSEEFDSYFSSEEETDHTSEPEVEVSERPSKADPVSPPVQPPQLDNLDGDWPQLVPEAVKRKCLTDFRSATELSPAGTCAVCARRTFNRDLLFTKSSLECWRISAKSIDLDLLKITDPHIKARSADYFRFADSSLNGLALDKAGVHTTARGTFLDICRQCHKCLIKGQLPALALANDNIRGYLPPHLQDVTWLEERLCAVYLSSAYVIRLYDLTNPGAAETRPRIMKGHTCSFPLNTVSTASKLPWTLGQDGALLSCIVIGPRKPRPEDLRRIFKVRKQKVIDLLQFLQQNFHAYPQVTIDRDAINSLPDDDVPELLMRHVVYEARQEVPSLFDIETAGVEQHPGLTPEDDEDGLTEDDNGRTFLEHHGVVDVNGVSVPAHLRSSAALANATGAERPDLIIRHGTRFVPEYNNPALFPGMFPTLFPWGTGGFELSRRTRLSFARQAKYLLDLEDAAFRRHWSFIFVVTNIKQRRAVHIGTRLACQAHDHPRFESMLRGFNGEAVKRVADHLAAGGDLRTLNGPDARIYTLLKKCELVSARVPGSRAIMTRAKADIQALIGQFGIPHLFLTLNPGPTHSPVFHVLYGDESVDLTVPMPTLPNASTRAIRVADDPVAASDYFHFHIYAAFKFLLGWDVRARKCTSNAGIFGRIAAFLSVKEHTMRGQLHCHTLIWLEGGLNPAALREKMHNSEAFVEQYLAFFDDIIKHELPSQPAERAGPGDAADRAYQPEDAAVATTRVDAEGTTDQPRSTEAATSQGHCESTPVGQTGPPATASKRFPRQERPPCPSDPQFSAKVAEDWLLLGEEVQRHRHTFTCFKNGRQTCRFLFPHPLVDKSYFDPKTNSIFLRVGDAFVNWHNALLLVALRHNMDVKAIQSGKSGVAAASYVAAYATKSDETPANQVSMIRTVYDRLLQAQLDVSDPLIVLSRCAMQFGREKQLHAQQAATYVRDLGDCFQSHITIPMLSGSLVTTILELFGGIRGDEAALSRNTSPEGDAADQILTDSTESNLPFQEPDQESSASHNQQASSSCDDSSPAVSAAEAVETTSSDSGLALQEPSQETTEYDGEQASNGYDDADNGQHAEDESSDGEQEHGLYRLNTKGLAHQVQDYVHRGDSLQALCFYDFVRFCKLTVKPKKWNRHLKTHHRLGESHPNKASHCHYYNDAKANGIPRPIISTFPRRNGKEHHGDRYCAAMMAHFIAFSLENPLKRQSETWEEAFRRQNWSVTAQRVMDNWAAINECSDARDAEELARRKREANRALHADDIAVRLAAGSDHAGMVDSNTELDMETLLDQRNRKSAETLDFVATLKDSGWFRSRSGPTTSSAPSSPMIWSTPPMNRAIKRKWAVEQGALEAQARADLSTPRAAAGVLAEQLSFAEGLEAQATTTREMLTPVRPYDGPLSTMHLTWSDHPPHELLDALVQERNLTPSQRLAFIIAGRRFFEQLRGVNSSPLRLLMHGEAGTGKTVVVRLLRELMDRFGCGRQITFVAPTGKAAAAIGGLTVHAAFCIDVHRRPTSSGTTLPAREDSAKKVRFLQDQFKDTRWVFLDEVSMTSCELLAQINKNLGIGTGCQEVPFGGVNMIFAGDLCQLPPVASSPLYTKASSSRLSAEMRTQVELGRTAWAYVDEVVEFTEQMRMRDTAMAQALRRLRLRQCTEADVKLFNGNVLLSHCNPFGTIIPPNRDVIILARTNDTVRTLNHQKAAIAAENEQQRLTVSYAIDKSTLSVNEELRARLLSYNGTSRAKFGIGRLPLYCGMPVVYRGPNQSVPLGITNGAFGKIEGWHLTRDRWGYTVPTGAVVCFDKGSSWKLTDLPHGCLPIYPTTSKLDFPDPQTPGSTHSISRRQLPLQPGFAMTVHSAQGITSQDGIAVDLTRGGFEAYVAASRATRKEDLFLLKAVTQSQLNSPPLPSCLCDELKRLAILAQATSEKHDHCDWRLVMPDDAQGRAASRRRLR